MNSISSLRILPVEPEAAALKRSTEAASGFREVLHSAIDDVQSLDNQAKANVAGLLEENGGDVHSGMIAVDKADLGLQLMMEVRNKVISAYEEISRMEF